LLEVKGKDRRVIELLTSKREGYTWFDFLAKDNIENKDPTID
jgi:hypothetical protein